jgi:hypothetical protein
MTSGSQVPQKYAITAKNSLFLTDFPSFSKALAKRHDRMLALSVETTQEL